MSSILKEPSCKVLKKVVWVAILFVFFNVGLVFCVQNSNAASPTILSHSSYLSITGAYWIFGEFQNLEATPIEFQKMMATFYDSSNNVIVVENWTIGSLEIVLPNQKSPFQVLLTNKTQAAMVDHYSLEVIYSVASALPLDLKIVSNSTRTDLMGYMHITGELENTGSINASSTKVYATFYDSAGKVVYTDDRYTDPSEILPGQTASYEVINMFSDTVPLVSSFSLTALSVGLSTSPSSTLSPTPTITPTSAPTLTLIPSISPTSIPSQSVTPPALTAGDQISAVAWVPPTQNAIFAPLVTAVAVGIASVVVAAAVNPGSTSTGKVVEKTRDFLPEGVKRWLEEFVSSKRKSSVVEKTGSPFLPTKPEILAYSVSLILLTISFSYVRATNELPQIFQVLPTVLVTAVIVEFVKTYVLEVFARSRGLWTEHRLWYFGLAMFLLTTFAFGVPFSSPSRNVYHAPKLTKRLNGIVASTAILVTLGFAAFFFCLLSVGFTLVGGTGLAMCIIMAFLDTFPVSPMNGKSVFEYSKALWAAFFVTTLIIYASWLLLL